MQIIDTQISPEADGHEWTSVTFQGDGGERITVRLRSDDLGDDEPDGIIGKAKVMLLHAASAGERRSAGSEVEIAPPIEPEEDPDEPEPGEGIDNSYQKPDEALPDDDQEAVLRRNPGLERTRFGEV